MRSTAETGYEKWAMTLINSILFNVWFFLHAWQRIADWNLDARIIIWQLFSIALPTTSRVRSSICLSVSQLNRVLICSFNSSSTTLQFRSLSHPFLVADTRLKNLPCRSVRRSVGPSVRQSVSLKVVVFSTFSAPAHPSATELMRGRVYSTPYNLVFTDEKEKTF